MGRLSNHAGMSAFIQAISGGQQVASKPPRAPGYYTMSFLGVQWSGRCVDHPLVPIEPKLKKYRTIPILPSRVKLEMQ